jgi:hypothetical protein
MVRVVQTTRVSPVSDPRFLPHTTFAFCPPDEFVQHLARSGILQEAVSRNTCSKQQSNRCMIRLFLATFMIQLSNA